MCDVIDGEVGSGGERVFDGGEDGVDIMLVGLKLEEGVENVVE